MIDDSLVYKSETGSYFKVLSYSDVTVELENLDTGELLEVSMNTFESTFREVCY